MIRELWTHSCSFWITFILNYKLTMCHYRELYSIKFKLKCCECLAIRVSRYQAVFDCNVVHLEWGVSILITKYVVPFRDFCERSERASENEIIWLWLEKYFSGPMNYDYNNNRLLIYQNVGWRLSSLLLLLWMNWGLILLNNNTKYVSLLLWGISPLLIHSENKYDLILFSNCFSQ